MDSSASSNGDAARPLELHEIQGNIAGFNKDHQRFVFLRFPSKDAAQGFLRVTLREVDTCDDVARFNASFKRARASGGRRPLPTARWFNLALTFAALQLLAPPELDSLPQEFKEGMRARAAALGDVDVNEPARWVPPFTEEIHAVALLAADVPEDLDRLYRQLQWHLRPRAIVVLGQIDGHTRPGEGRGHEHFGFKDGISQPGIAGLTRPEDLKPGQELVAPGEFILGYPEQDGTPPIPPPPSGYDPPPPAPEPSSGPEWTRNGSYVVFRRLRQDVRGFDDFVRQAAGQTGLRPDLLEAKLVGRYKSGAPLERTRDQAGDFDPQAADPSIADDTVLGDDKINNFEYAPHDADGTLVPRAAHIRKTYPRNQETPGEAEADRRRILRRGIPYGPEFVETENPYPSGDPPPDQDRGLLFLCYQASIADQFEFIQTQWANRDEFPQAEDGRDPIISQDVSDPKFKIPPGEERLILARWVITTGGEYFFSPSISAMHFLAGSPPESR